LAVVVSALAALALGGLVSFLIVLGPLSTHMAMHVAMMNVLGATLYAGLVDRKASRAPAGDADARPNPAPRPKEELDQLERIWALPKGWRILSAVNNTVIGYFYIGTALVFFLLAGILALLMAQLAVPSNTFLSQETYNQIFTMHGTVMTFLFAAPAVEAKGSLLLPQMLGARDLPSFRRRLRVLRHAILRSRAVGRAAGSCTHH
jgi:hypothetical protein